MDNLLVYGLGFVLTAVLIWLLQPLARRIGLVDHPGGRKRHAGTVPLIGGVAMFAGLVACIAVAGRPPFDAIAGLLAGGGLVLVVGTIDDLVALTPLSRFVTQITAAVMMVVFGDVYLHDLGFLMGDTLFTLGSMSIPLTVFGAVGVINAINMSDGADGLAGGLTLVTVLALGIVAGVAGHSLFYLFPALLAVLLGFLVFNLRTPWRPKAKVFMGNGGSMLLGFIVAWILVSLSQGEQAVISPVTALWVFAIPLMDTVCIMLRRIIKGRSPFAPDRQHFHHALMKAGYSVSQSVWIMIGLATLLAGFGMLGHYGGVPDYIMFFAFLVLFTAYFMFMQRTWKNIIVNRRRHPRQSGGGTRAEAKHPVKRAKEE